MKCYSEQIQHRTAVLSFKNSIYLIYPDPAVIKVNAGFSTDFSGSEINPFIEIL